jgi:hypothetical protein
MPICTRTISSTAAALRLGLAAILGFALVSTVAMVGPLSAQETLAEKIAELTPEQRRIYDTVRSQRASFDAELDGYWAAVNARRDERKRKHASAQPYTSRDYVLTQPPKYAGPALPDAIAKLIQLASPPPLDPERAGVADFLHNAKTIYKFIPEVTTETDFKRRYAAEAIAIGLTKEQVVKVYALETGGIGTYDMQAGIHPQKRTGKPISSALGYAQLLHANSVNELVKHGSSFIQRLETMAQQDKSPTPWRKQSLRTKAYVVRAMLADARSVPNDWSEHVRLGGTPKGLAIHALNLDADIGPWLQVIKLKGLKETAMKEGGRAALTGPEIELLNLAGPRTGLEMLSPVAQTMPTTNFFSRKGYERNSVVRERTAAELLVELGRRMEFGLQKPGSIEFGQAFDTLPRR